MLLSSLICLLKGHIPMHDGHVTTEVYGYWLTPDFLKLMCARCQKTVHLVSNAFLKEDVQHWELSERAKRGLVVHRLLGDFGSYYQHQAVDQIEGLMKT